MGPLCPSRPESIKFLREGTDWLFRTFPDIGGVNLENGDWVSCHCERCMAQKAKPENDASFYWDMMASQVDAVRIGLKHDPDAWMTFATYTPFTEDLIRRDLKTAMKSKAAQAVKYPPRFLNQYDPRAIAQWTVTWMHHPNMWPADATVPPGRLKHHIAFTHLNSYYCMKKTDPDRWWSEPNSTYDEGSEVLFFQIPRAVKGGFEGFVIKGFSGSASPQHDLFYLTFEELTWYPDSTPERFFEHRLTEVYGGAARARQFLKMLRNTTKDPAEILADKAKAEAAAVATERDPRVSLRWRNLAGELGRRVNWRRRWRRRAKSGMGSYEDELRGIEDCKYFSEIAHARGMRIGVPRVRLNRAEPKAECTLISVSSFKK